MNEFSMRRYSYIALLIVGALLTALVFWPFAKILIVSIALSAILYPLYNWLLKKLKVKWVASFFTILIFTICLIIPLLLIGTIVFKQSQHLYSWIINQGGLENVNGLLDKYIGRLFPGGAIDFENSLTNLTGRLTAGIGTAFTATVSTLFSFLLIILSMFYFLKDGEVWKKIIFNFSPLSEKSGHQILSRLNAAVNGIVKGYLLIALIQGFLMAIGLFIFGVPHAALWGVVAGIASMVPMIGTSLVSIPAVLFLFISGNVGQAIGLAIWAAALVGTIDNFLTPLVVGRKIEIHPLLVLFSVLGGIALMGPLGILIGPLIISFLYSLVSVYKSEIGQ